MERGFSILEAGEVDSESSENVMAFMRRSPQSPDRNLLIESSGNVGVQYGPWKIW